MNLLTRKQFAELVNKSPQEIGVYISRGKLFEKNRMLDTEHPINSTFITANTFKNLEKQGVVFSKPKVKKVKPVKDNQNWDVILGIAEEPEQIPEIESSYDEFLSPLAEGMSIDRTKKLKEIARIEADTKLKELELLKKKAKILPLEFVIEWAARNIRGVFGETVNFGDVIIEQICNEIGAGIDVKLEYKKKFRQGFHEILNNGVKNQEPEAVEMANEYALTTKW